MKLWILRSQDNLKHLLRLVFPLALALAFQIPILHFNHMAAYDEALHLDCARSILRTGLPIRRIGVGQVYLNHPPLYLYLLALFQGLVGDGLHAGRFLGVLCSLAVVIATYGIAWLLAPSERPTGWKPVLASSIVAVHPLFIVLGVSLHFEILLTAWILGSLWAILLAERRGRPSLYLLAGILLGMALLTKALALVFLGAFGLYQLVRYRQRVFAMPTVYWVIIPSLALFALWFLFGMLTDPALFISGFSRWVNQTPIAHDPRVGISGVVWLGQIINQGLGPPLSLLASGALLWGGLQYKRNPPTSLLGLYMMLGIGASLLVSTKEIRHLLPLIPIAAVVGANFLVFVLSQWHQHRGGRVLSYVLIGGLLVLISPLEFAATNFPPYRLKSSYRWEIWEEDLSLWSLREAGQWLQKHTSPDMRLLTTVSGPIIGYYSDRYYDLLYVHPYDIAYSLIQNAQILVEDVPLISPHALPELDQAERARIMALVEQNFVPVYQVSWGGREVILHARIGSELANESILRPLRWETGVYPSEMYPDGRTFRWTNGWACTSSYGDWTHLAMEINAFRPSHHPPVKVTIRVNGAPIHIMNAPAEWTKVRIPLPASEGGRSSWDICLESETMVPRVTFGSSDDRVLGIMVANARLEREIPNLQ